MGRPATYSTDEFVGAAVDLYASGGARALTMSGVARAMDAASGSIYHRFPDRPALLAAVWMHTVRAFQSGYRRALGDDPTVDDAVRAAEWIVDWCRENPSSAAVLHAGIGSFAPESWSADDRRDLEALEHEQTREMKEMADTITRTTGLPRDQALFALFDLPLAVVRRHLTASQAPPPRSRTMVRELTYAILRSRTERTSR
ncbi:MAG TPA: TetR/AcrR family transcriptional regulator [Micromonospora sp.]